jgi:hypothetical protein
LSPNAGLTIARPATSIVDRANFISRFIFPTPYTE